MGTSAHGDARHERLTSWGFLISIYAVWGLATWFHEAIPLWLLAPLGAVLIAWHGSFQHEAVHDHFSSRRWLNDLIAYPPLMLWLPYPIYRRTHRAHHNMNILTDPRRDPESYYVDRARWQRLPAAGRLLLTWHNTLAGRLLLGPFLVIGQFLISEGRALLSGDQHHLKIWLLHLPAAALVISWLTYVDMPLWTYACCFVLPGLSLTLVRSFAEHKAAHTPEERTAIVEAGAFFSLLFLNNNLHFAHHRRPDLPWQALPAYYRRYRDTLLKENGGLCYADGYREIARRFLVRPVDRPDHPFL
ncbi:MAG: fatty acid desaturase [Geminicoccaceae bacterium]